MLRPRAITQAYRLARDRYADHGVDTATALTTLASLRVSLHCWQGDDVAGFEGATSPGAGLAVTGNHPGKARTPDELRSDLDQALRLIPGKHRLNLHASYGEFTNRKPDRDAIQPENFQGWIDYARSRQLGLDFNPTFFAHPLADSGFTLTHPDPAIRTFWIEHGRRCREIGAAFGRALKTPCINNVWIPDGYKDTPADRHTPRARLAHSLDAIFKRRFPPTQLLDSVEPKLFGIGSESYVVGSHEFYLGYAVTRQKLLCLDSGHFHPTEGIADKISAVLQYLPRILIHVSRGVRWDSDHVVTQTDELLAIAREIVANGYLPRVALGLDYFDASINRVAAWVIGARNLLRALLIALLEPSDRLREAEQSGDLTTRLVLQEEARALPWNAVWDYHCHSHDAPIGASWLPDIQRYEQRILPARS